MSLTNSEISTKFYTFFQNKDYSNLNALYDKKAVFQDPVFGKLPAWKAKAMWWMLCERGVDLKIDFEVIKESEDLVFTRWIASYTFSKTNRKIKNKILSKIQINNDKIISHKDTFNFWKWLGMAMGWKGYLLGWAPFVRNKVREEALNGLEMFIKRKRITEDS